MISSNYLLTPPQAEVLNSGLLESGFSCILQMPTGSGKTWLAEQAIESTLKKGARAIYISPLKALAAELCERWTGRFSSPVGVFTGDYGISGNPFPVPFEKARLLVMTPERLDACTRHWRSHWNWIPQVDLVVVDEIHLLGEGRRGARLEGALSRFCRLNPFARILGLSATLGNRAELADWLNGVEFYSDWRPIPLQWRFARYRKADEKPTILKEEVYRNVTEGGQSLVFVQSRRRAEELSRFLQQQGLLVQHHHAGLSRTDRHTREEHFRNHQLQILVATSTLEMGLNLPARQVILYDVQSFDGSDFKLLSTNSVWQRVGRAGRPGLDSTGEAVLIIPSWDNSAEKYLAGEFETIRSCFSNPSLLSEQVIAEVSSGLARTPTQLQRVFSNSLAARQEILPKVEKILAQMQAAGMIQEKVSDDNPLGKSLLRATRLGRIAVRHFLTPETILFFQNILTGNTDLTFFDLLLTISSAPDCEPVLPVDYEELDELAEILAKQPSFLLQRTTDQVLENWEISGKRLLAGIKMALVLREWARCGDTIEVGNLLDCYPTEVSQLQESATRMLQAMQALLPKAIEDEQLPLQDTDNLVSKTERIRALSRMVGAGLDESAATLTLVEGVGAVRARILSKAGIKDLEDLALIDPEEFRPLPGISHKTIVLWNQKATELVHEVSAYHYRENGPFPQISPPGWPQEVDLYRLRRAIDLRVAGAEGGVFLVKGGLEPHRVSFRNGAFKCDCVDAGRGNLCKHVLAVRLYRGDPDIKKLSRMITQSKDSQTLDLFNLWSRK